MGNAEKTTDRRPNMHKAGARYAGHSDGDTPAPSTSSEFIIYSSNRKCRGISPRRGV
jgi:hypothetical protein